MPRITPERIKKRIYDARKSKSALVALSREEEQKLLLEYDWLTDGQLRGLLTPWDQQRLQRVESRLDLLDTMSPAAADMRQKQDEIKKQLQELIARANRLTNAS